MPGLGDTSDAAVASGGLVTPAAARGPDAHRVCLTPWASVNPPVCLCPPEECALPGACPCLAPRHPAQPGRSLGGIPCKQGRGNSEQATRTPQVMVGVSGGSRGDAHLASRGRHAFHSYGTPSAPARTVPCLPNRVEHPPLCRVMLFPHRHRI